MLSARLRRRLLVRILGYARDGQYRTVGSGTKTIRRLPKQIRAEKRPTPYHALEHDSGKTLPGLSVIRDLEQILPGPRLSPPNTGGVVLASIAIDPDCNDR